MGYKPLKKITVKEVCGKISLREIMPPEGEEAQVIPLMDIFGIATKAKVGVTDTGEFVRFIGQFRATNLRTGETSVSGQCILPGAIPDLIYGALGQDNVFQVQFAFRIGVKFDESAVAKYVYDVESLTDIGESDPLSLLVNAVQATGKLPALSAPESAPAPATKPEPEPTKAADPAPAPAASAKRARVAA